VLRLELVERFDSMVLDDPDACVRRQHCEPANESRRLGRRVARMEDSGWKPTANGIGMPLRLEAVFAERFELGPDLVAFFIVRGETEAAGPPDRVAAEQREPVKVIFGQPPEFRGSFRAQGSARVVVRHRPAAQREAAVAAACAFRDPARIVDADALPGVGERQRGGDAGDAGADDLGVRLRNLDGAEIRRGLLGQPPGRHRADATSPSRVTDGCSVEAVALAGEPGQLELC
jgi:hypothetical protein